MGESVSDSKLITPVLSPKSPGGKVSFFLDKQDSTDSGSSYVDPSYKPKLLKQSGTSIDSSEFDPERCVRLLVLYCGGTIGMKSHEGVYSPEPNFLVGQLRRLPMFHDDEYPHYHGDDWEKPLVMPLSKEGKRVVYSVFEYEPLLDSANMTVDDYARLAGDIADNYDRFHGFVILHGTDTMAYTASALSFMLENLGKPVILTGSQIPIFETRSDGRDNFLGALIMAGHYNIPEVCVYFNNVLLRGNRSTKADSEAFDAFKSPNIEPLAKLEIHIHVNWDAIYRPMVVKKFHVHPVLCANVGVLRLFPSITKETVEAFLQPPMQGVVLQSYGAGNGPSARADLTAVLKESCDRGVIIVNTTQCSKGIVLTSYETGKVLLDAGVIPGADMTAEASLMKLSYILSKEEWPLDKKRRKIRQNLRGELTSFSLEKRSKSVLEFSILEKMAEAMRISSSEEVRALRDTLFPSLLCTAAKEGNIHEMEKIRNARGRERLGQTPPGGVLNQGDYDGRTPLHVASAEGHDKLVEYLLHHGATVHTRDRYGHCALDDAVRFQHLEVIKHLRAAGAHLVLPPCRIGMMLCSTVVMEDVRGLEAWHLSGLNLNQGDYDKRTALHMACSLHRLDMVEWLVAHGAKTDVVDDFGNTPLDEAKKHHSQDIIKILEGSLTKHEPESVSN